ncbi:MAG: hypothetical protein JWP82_1840 [Humibacillus sp.]|nr:hypothetical protein [Humibacillus sp.]
MVRESGERFVTRARRWVLNQPPFEWLTGGFLVILLASGLFGGLDTVDPDPVRTVAAGVPVATEPLTVTVTKTYAASTFPNVRKVDGVTPTVYPDEPTGGRFVVVEATVENTSDATVSYDVIREAVSLGGASGFVGRKAGTLVAAEDARASQVYTMPEKLIFGSAQPGVTYRVAYLFDQSSTATLPSMITVAVNKHTWRQDTLEFSYGWKDPEVTAASALPLAEQAPS